MPANATLEQVAHYTGQVGEVFEATPGTTTASRYSFARRLRRDAARAVGRARPQHLSDHGRGERELAGVTGLACPCSWPSARADAGFVPFEFVIASTASHEELLRFAEQIVQSGGDRAVRVPADHRRALIRRNARISIDREKVAAMGSRWRGSVATSRLMVGGNFVNRFDLDGDAYKVIPQIERAARPPRYSSRRSTSRARRHVCCRCRRSRRYKKIEPRTLNRFRSSTREAVGHRDPSLDGG